MAALSIDDTYLEGLGVFPKMVRVLSVVVICSVILCGWGLGKGETSPGNLTIVTSFYPMYVSTVNVTKDVPGVQVINMTQPQTGCLHDYQLTPQDLKTLEAADVFVINGAGMEAFLDKAVSQQPQLKVVNASNGIALIRDKDGEENPHVWVSISNTIRQVNNIAEQLAAIDSANAAQYRSNASDYVQKLSALRDRMHMSLDNLPNKNIITFHEAFPYFASEFNLNIVGVIEREPGTEPTPQELADTIQKVKDWNIKALFAEPQYPYRAAATISIETGAKMYFLDPAVTGVANLNAYDDYLDVMDKNLRTLLEALN
jgi:zinc transport system substrate-binding protein